MQGAFPAAHFHACAKTQLGRGKGDLSMTPGIKKPKGFILFLQPLVLLRGRGSQANHSREAGDKASNR